MVKMIQDVVDFCKAKRTLANVSEVIFAAETLLQQFPCVTLEEFRLICDRLKQGYYGNKFERLMIEEFRSALIALEEDRASMLETLHTRQGQAVEREFDVNKNVYEPTTMEDLRRKRNEPIFALAAHIANLPKDPTNEETDTVRSED